MAVSLAAVEGEADPFGAGAGHADVSWPLGSRAPNQAEDQARNENEPCQEMFHC